MSISLMSILGGAAVGGALGGLYLGLLWLAVRSLPQERSGVLVFVGLGFVRVVLLLGALVAAAALGLPVEGIAAAVLGFVIVRVALTRWLARNSPEDGRWK